jgi:hypothetical protein
MRMNEIRSMNNYTSLSECLEVIHSGQDFSVKFRTFNRMNKSGGRLIEIHSVKLLTKKEVKEKALVNKDSLVKKNPNHYDNRTRNLLLPNNEIRKVNILFITEFNGEKVIY